MNIHATPSPLEGEGRGEGLYPPPPSSDKPISPGVYLRKRREHAGLTRDEVAHLLSHRAAHRPLYLEEITELEEDRSHAADVMLHKLQYCFRFDRFVYHALVACSLDEFLPRPQVCRNCACSWMDACGTPGAGQPCHWVDGDSTLCSACLPVEPTRPAPAPGRQTLFERMVAATHSERAREAGARP